MRKHLIFCLNLSVLACPRNIVPISRLTTSHLCNSNILIFSLALALALALGFTDNF